uniref:Uncharacterized protein n=1 Tax=Fagus sylvatica TaxID=28930 RepID=A0A2N9GWL0_FAGSY
MSLSHQTGDADLHGRDPPIARHGGCGSRGSQWLRWRRVAVVAVAGGVCGWICGRRWVVWAADCLAGGVCGGLRGGLAVMVPFPVRVRETERENPKSQKAKNQTPAAAANCEAAKATTARRPDRSASRLLLPPPFSPSPHSVTTPDAQTGSAVPGSAQSQI